MNNRFLTFAIAVGAVCFTGFTASAHHGPDGFDRTMQVIDRISRIFSRRLRSWHRLRPRLRHRPRLRS